MSKLYPIGVFDSGVGGLSILQEIRKLLPQEDFLYFADSAYCPYGGRPVEIIRNRAVAIGTFLQARGAKAMVVASNTTSASGLESLRRELSIPVIGVEPAVKPAVQLSNSGKVGVLATGVTLRSSRFNSLLHRYCEGVEVLTQPCPGLVEAVESGDLDSARPLLHTYLAPLLKQGVTLIVLGCTHYPFLRPIIAELCGPKVTIIDSGEAVARQVMRVLDQFDLNALRSSGGIVQMFTSGDPVKVQPVVQLLWGDKDLTVERINL